MSAARPINSETLLSPELAVHTFSEASTAIAAGAFSTPNTVGDDIRDAVFLWEDADPDLVPLVQVRRGYAKLPVA